MKESIENSSEEKNLSLVREELERIKDRETKNAEEDGVIGPWNHIDVSLLNDKALRVFEAHNKDQARSAQERLSALKVEIDEMKVNLGNNTKDKKILQAMENFYHWIDDRVANRLVVKQLEEESQKDN